MNISKFFIDRPIFAGVLSTLIFLAGLLSLPALPISEYPGSLPADRRGACAISGREPESDRGNGRNAD